MSVPFALSSAVAYGFGDFAGGLATRKTPVVRVTAVAQVAGLAVLLLAALLVPGQVSGAALGFGAVAGVGGMLGLLLYMRGLAVGPMGVVAPLSAVVGAGLPLVAGVLGGERPGVVGWLALAVALVAIGLASAGSRGDAAAGVEPRRQAVDEVPRPVAGDPRLDGLRQRLQDPVGALHPPRRRRGPVDVDARGRRQGRAARRSGAVELEGTALDRRAGVESLTRPR